MMAIAGLVGVLISRRIRKADERKNQVLDDKYNDFHLGEMTSLDTKPKFTQRNDGTTQWSGRTENKNDKNKNIKTNGKQKN